MGHFMDIKTALNLDDDAFLMRDNKVVTGVVKEITVQVGAEGQYGTVSTSIVYKIAIQGVGPANYMQSVLFPTKEALLASL
jgi:hypothetical protein